MQFKAPPAHGSHGSSFQRDYMCSPLVSCLASLPAVSVTEGSTLPACARHATRRTILVAAVPGQTSTSVLTLPNSGISAQPLTTSSHHSAFKRPVRLLEQAIPDLVRSISRSSGQSVLQLCTTDGWVGGLNFHYTQLPQEEASNAKVWGHVAEQCRRSPVAAVILARPIPDPASVCLHTSDSHATTPNHNHHQPSTQAKTAVASLRPPVLDFDPVHSQMSSNRDALAAMGVLSCCSSQGSCCPGAAAVSNNTPDLQGSVDMDGCCGGEAAQPPPSQVKGSASVHHGNAKSSVMPGGSSIQSANNIIDAQRLKAQQMVRSHTGITSSSVLGTASSSSSSSSSSSEDEADKTAASSQQQQQAPLRSRRRFLRRQQQKMRAQAAASNGNEQDTTGRSSSTGHGVATSEVRYYGLAVQSVHQDAEALFMPGVHPAAAQPDGCYVLKLCNNRDATGCTCTMFTLTHVCQGQPLYQQLLGSWLA